jgi:hypothetical protein
VLPALAAVVPGVVLHGTGHAVAGDWDTALKLLATEGAALAAMTTGITLLARFGASRRVSTPAIMVLIGGAGLFTNAWLADIYGAAGGGLGRAPALLPWVEASAGYRYVYDPLFSYRHFARVAAQGRVRAWRLEAEAMVATDDDNQRWRGAVTWRPYGVDAASAEPRADAIARAAQAPHDGTAIDVTLGAVYHRHGAEGFGMFAPELSVTARLDLQRISPSLSGSFSELRLGWAVELYDYNLPDLGLGADVVDELIGRFAFGVYLGQGRGEVALYYDHRKSGYEGGLATRSGANGPMGSFGIEGACYITDAWGLSASFAVGSAYVAGLNGLYRFGGQPL